MDTGSIIGHIKFLDDQIFAWEAHHGRLQARTQQPDTLDLSDLCRTSASYVRRLKGDRSEALAALKRLESKEPTVLDAEVATYDERTVMIPNVASPAAIQGCDAPSNCDPLDLV